MLLVTGATGFLGEHVVGQLVAAGLRPACFVRATSHTAPLERLGLPLHAGGLGDVDGLARALAGVEVLVNLASLGFGHAPAILAACRRAGVQRAVFISTTAIFTTLDAGSKATRLAAEQAIRDSGLAWTILRPTMIYGTERDRNMARLVRYLARWPIIPVLGPGDRLQQPVHVADLAAAVVAAVQRPVAQGKAYNVSGAAPLTYNEVIDETARALNRRVLKLHLPVGVAVATLRAYERIAPRPVLKAEQALRLNEDKAFDHAEAARDLGFAPRSFADGIRAQVRRMRGLGLI